MESIFLILFLLISGTLAAAEQVFLSPEMETLRKEGSEALFNMDYEKAKSFFEQMTMLDSSSPSGHIYLANAIWLKYLSEIRRLQTDIYNRNESFFAQTEDEADPQIENQFRSNVNKGIQLTEQKLRRDSENLEALYYLGVAKNLIGSYEATVKRSFLSALRSGSKGVGYHRKVVKKNPSIVDAELSIGMYNYVVGSLPLTIKILAFLGGVHGSKKEGIKILEKVAKEGIYSRDEAAVLLIMLYDREKKREQSLRLLQEQEKKYPGNFIYRLQIASTLSNMGRSMESLATFESLLKERKAYEYMPDLIHYQYAEALFRSNSFEDALKHYEKAAASSKAPPPLVTMSVLGQGRCLDASQRRSEAVAKYQTVLKRPEVFDSHDHARRFLKKPYQP